MCIRDSAWKADEVKQSLDKAASAPMVAVRVDGVVLADGGLTGRVQVLSLIHI